MAALKEKKQAGLHLHFSEIHVVHPVFSEERRGALPDLAFFLDSSSSMTYDPIVGRGAYDILLRTLFGVFKWLREEGVAPYLHYAALNFSSRTLYSGWRSWSDRSELDEIFFHHQNSNTCLDTRVAGQLVREAPRGFMAIMISDGELDDDEEAWKFIRDHFQAPAGFVLIQVGSANAFSRQLKTFGFKVHVIDSFDALTEIVAMEIRGRYGRQAAAS